ncbi:hypothetical protein KSS87_008924 [Heliosperma pusillum]|nr:hypothetical protein KSS87_008924 [Heliosperma pusillum]
MSKLYSLIISLFFLAVTIHGVTGGTMVSGTVFCDQCKDGQVSVFDYPLSGMKVAMVCPGTDGQMIMVEECTTNMLGDYGMTFRGTPDLSRCYTQISANSNRTGSPNSCGAATGPPKTARLMFTMFDFAMYTVDPLISQPAQPMSYCSTSSSSSSSPTTHSPPPSVGSATPVSPSTPPREFTPVFRLPPMLGLPPFPPSPFLQQTACSYQKWMMTKYKCKWGAMKPDMRVGLVFGPLAAGKYGKDMTLYEGLQGRGDPYKTLLREAVTSLLNSYNNFHFPYNAFQVFTHFNAALAGSNRTVMLTALRFKRANSGGHALIPCKLTSCRT